MQQIWKHVPGHQNYIVSSLGEVYNSTTGKMLKPKNNNGYFRVSLGTKHVSLHRLVAKMFLPTPEEGKNQVNHIDGDKSHNYVDNLEWMSQSENIRHGIATGLYDKRFNRRRLTESFVTDVLKEYEPGVPGKSLKALARKYDLSEGTLRGRIKKRLSELDRPLQETLALG